MNKQIKAILKYPGAKNRLADWICSYMPKQHKVYLELFAGSCAVLLHKERSHIETINDLDGEVVNFFRVLRNNPEELAWQILFTPYARDEYANAYMDGDGDVERARRFCVKCWQGFGCGNLYRNGFKSGQQSNSPNPARAWSELPENILLMSERFKGVQIENLPAVELLSRYDTEDVFIYADPPYPHETRKPHLYKHEMDNAEHEVLLKALINHPGKIMLSSYPNEMYDDILSGWRRVLKDTNAERGLKRTEVLYMNYSDEQISLFDYMGTAL